MKKRIIILGSLVLLVVLGWTAGWFFIAGQVRQQVELLALGDGETSPQLQCGTLDVSGFPFRFDVDCANATVVSADLMVEVPGIRASAMVLRPTHLIASAEGPAKISDAFTGLEQAVAWSGMEASLRLDDWRIARLSMVANDVAWSDQLFGDTLIASAPQVELHLLDMPEQHNAETRRAALAGYLRATDVTAPGIELDPTNAEVELEVTALPDDVRDWGVVPFLPDWQQAGGTLRIVGIRANDGTADLDASGELALDANGYPAGSIAIDSMGVAERIAPLLEEPWRTLVLGVPGEDGRHKNQLNFGGGALSSGLVPIAALAPMF
jgi:hypothetical protein